MHIRRMKPEEAEHVAGLVRDALNDPTLAKTEAQRRATARFDAETLTRHNKRRFGVFVAEEHSNPIGLGLYTAQDECLVYVSPARRGMDLGGQLLDAMMHAVDDAGDKMVINVAADKARYFTARGFEVTGHIDEDPCSKLVMLEYNAHQKTAEKVGGWLL